MLMGPTGRLYQILSSGHKLRSCTGMKGQWSLITLIQEAERNYGALRQAERERMTLRNQMSRNSRKLLERKSEMAQCNSRPPGEKNRVFLDTGIKG